MGQGLLLWYKEKCKPGWKIAFVATFVVGILVHIYKFTNTALVGDSLLNFYFDQDMTVSGRWFLQYACGISSYFDLPWLNGLFSIIYISLTMVVITEIFKMTNPVLICVCSAFIVTYPAVTSTLFYGFTADGYMMAMLLASVGVYLLRFSENRVTRLILAGICLCLSCGIYQAYISFALVLLTFTFWQEVLENKKETKEVLKWVGTRAAVVIGALASYWIIWKICLKVKNLEAVDYQGIDTVGQISVSGLFDSAVEMAETLAKVIFDWDPTVYGINFIAVMNIIFLAAFGVITVVALVKSGIKKNKAQLVLFLLSIVAIPFFICMWQFTSADLKYHILMLQSVSLIFIFTAVLFERWAKVKLRSALGVLLTVMVVYFSVEANISYYHFNIAFEKSHAIASEMVHDIQRVGIDENVKKLAVVGYRGGREFSAETKNYFRYSYIGHMRGMDSITRNEKAYCFIEHYFDTGLEPVDDEYADELLFSDEVKAMPIWPAEGSVKVIGDTMVVKLSTELFDPLTMEMKVSP